MRDTISWHACALGDTGVAPAEPAIDYDLFLFNRTTGEYVVGSQSFADNNEGYDYTITDADGEGEYETWVSAIPGTPCEGAASEPFGWAYWRW